MKAFAKTALLFTLVSIVFVAGCTQSPSGSTIINKTSQQTSCTPNWSCTAWSVCSSTGTQTRTCTDSNSCGITSGKPDEIQSCTPPATKKDVTISFSSSLKNSVTVSAGGQTATMEPSAGDIFLQVDMTIKNNGYDKFNTNPLYFELVVNNVAYTLNYNSFIIDNRLQIVNVLNGGSTSGSLLFEIPQSESSASFSMDYGGYCDSSEKCNIIWTKI